MKRTTYIIIGLFVLGLLLIPILLRTPAAEKTAHRLTMEGERTEIEMAGIRHGKIVEKLGEIDKDDIGVLGKLDVQASSFSDKSILVYPKSKYLNVSQEGDCLLVEINLDDKYVTRQEYDDLRGKYEELYSYLESATKPEGGKHGISIHAPTRGATIFTSYPHSSNFGIALFLIKSICSGSSPLVFSSNITSEKIIKSRGSLCSCARIILAVLSLPPDHEAIYFIRCISLISQSSFQSDSQPVP